MRKLVLITGSILILNLVNISSIFSQNIAMFVSGIIVDIENALPIPNHDVHLEISSGGSTQEFELVTNSEGLFFKDSIITNGSGYVSAQVYDCNEVLHEFEQMISPANTNLFFDFMICADSSVNCTADYTWGYVPGNDLYIQFIDLSAGYVEDWLWDFGDGNISNEQNPVHLYNAPGTYDVCLTISTADSLCYDTYCQPVQVDSIISDCENWFNFDTEDNLTFIFEGFAIPDATEWLWDFGDGSTGSGPIITHTFDPVSPGYYNVKLTTLHYAPAGGDTCIAISMQPVFAGASCQAFFNAEQSPDSPLSWNFFDQSTGSPNFWLWEFGDGSFSEDQNPQHIFPEPGIYEVCLSIISDSLGYVCTDNYCDSIVIDFELQAAFNASLDTVTGQTNRYIFEDISTGNPDSWLWDFGDGTTSTEQNPVHIFDQSGSYQTCLTVSRTLGTQVYQDQFCLNHNTPNYFNFGGTVFLGNAPMNNLNGDTTIVDVALAYLYKKYDDALIPVDTTMFHQYGYYYFTDVREGDYIVKIELMENSEHFGQFLPGYHLHSHTWTGAHSLQLNDENNFVVNVHLDPLNGLENGPGSIGGYVNITGSEIVQTEQLENVEIIIFNDNLQPLAYHKTDENGYFNFSSIALGTYYLHAESAGLYTVTEMVVLDEETSIVDDLNLNLHTEILDLPQLADYKFRLGNIYPNPAIDKIFLQLENSQPERYHFAIADITGKRYLQKTIQTLAGDQLMHLDIHSLPAGFYLLSVKSESSGHVEIRKFIK